MNSYKQELIQVLLLEGRLPLSDACRAIRAAQGVSQEEFAKRIGINKKVVKGLEAGKGNPRQESLERIAKAAGLRIAFVSEGSTVSVLDPRERLAAEKKRRLANHDALREGVSPEDLYKRNAVGLGGVELRLPKLA